MKKNYQHLLKISAFLVPVYFIYHPQLQTDENDALTKSLLKYTYAGFCFYAILMTVIILLKQ